jgi:O-antigen/teichoic acid export membrane protein
MKFKKLIVQSIFWRGLYFLTVLLLNVLVARLFEASGSGWIYYVSSIYALIILVANLSLDSGMAFYISSNEINVNKLLNLSVLWTTIVGLLVLTASLVYLRYRPSVSDRDTLIVVSALSYICGNLLTNYCGSIFYSLKNYYTPNIIGIGCNLSLIIILLITTSGAVAILNPKTFLYIYFLIFVVQACILVITIIYLHRVSWQPVILSRAEFKKVLRYSLVAFAGNIIFYLVYRVDYFFVRYLCTPADLGNYIQVSKLGQMLILLPSIMSSAVFSMVAGGQREEVNRGLKLLSRMSLLIIGCLCIVLIMIGHWVFVFVFGQSFDRMYQPFVLLVPGILTAYYSGKNKLRVNIIGSFIALFFIVVADFILIPKYGINAAALTSSIGYILYHIYILSIYKSEYKTPITGFFIIKKSDLTWLKNFVTRGLGTNLTKEL